MPTKSAFPTPASTDVRRIIVLLAVAGACSGASFRVADPLLPKIADEFQVSLAAAAGIVTGFALAYGLFQLVHGPLGDSLGKLRAVTLALGIAAAGSLACAAASSLSALILFRFMAGVGAAGVIPLSFAFIGDNVPYERRQEVLGSFIAGTLLGQSLGPLLGGVFSDYFGWRLAFVTIAAGFLTLGLLLWPYRSDASATPRAAGFNPLARYAMLLQRRNVRLVLAAVAAEGFLFFGAFGFLGAWLQLRFGLSYTAIGLIAAGYGVGGLLYSLGVRRLVQRLGERGLVTAGGGVLLMCFVALALAPSWRVCPPLVIGLGLGYFMLHNTLQTRATEMAPEARGSAVSFFAMCLFLSQAAGVALAGHLVPAVGFEALFLAAGLGLAALAWWFRRQLQALHS